MKVRSALNQSIELLNDRGCGVHFLFGLPRILTKRKQELFGAVGPSAEEVEPHGTRVSFQRMQRPKQLTHIRCRHFPARIFSGRNEGIHARHLRSGLLQEANHDFSAQLRDLRKLSQIVFVFADSPNHFKFQLARPLLFLGERDPETLVQAGFGTVVAQKEPQLTSVVLTMNREDERFAFGLSGDFGPTASLRGDQGREQHHRQLSTDGVSQLFRPLAAEQPHERGIAPEKGLPIRREDTHRIQQGLGHPAIRWNCR